jgi:16S rRNA processing protein RimM
VLLGRFGAPHGVRGEIRLQSFTADPRSIADYSPLMDKSGARRFVIQAVRPQGKDMLVARVDGVGDRESAEALRGVELYVAREFLPKPDEDEFYLADLEGLRAETADGVLLGRVVAIHNFGAGDILEIAPPQGESLLFPFTKSVAPLVDVAGGRIVIAPPPETEPSEEEG